MAGEGVMTTTLAVKAVQQQYTLKDIFRNCMACAAGTGCALWAEGLRAC
jgi:hypothetical protein